MAYGYEDMMGDPQPAHMGSQSQTGTQMAGDVVPFPKTLADADKQRIYSGKALDSGYISRKDYNSKPTPIKPGQ